MRSDFGIGESGRHGFENVDLPFGQRPSRADIDWQFVEESLGGAFHADYSDG